MCVQVLKKQMQRGPWISLGGINAVASGPWTTLAGNNCKSWHENMTSHFSRQLINSHPPGLPGFQALIGPFASCPDWFTCFLLWLVHLHHQARPPPPRPWLMFLTFEAILTGWFKKGPNITRDWKSGAENTSICHKLYLRVLRKKTLSFAINITWILRRQLFLCHKH